MQNNVSEGLKHDTREVLSSSIAFVGPQRLLSVIENNEIKEMFSKVYWFHIPDDYGEFPDTTGYTKKNWENLESELEDNNLYPFMQKALDAIVEFNNKRAQSFAKMDYMDVEGFLHSPKFGGKVWAVGGAVRGFPPRLILH